LKFWSKPLGWYGANIGNLSKILFRSYIEKKLRKKDKKKGNSLSW
jgi:hypothetical protein